MMTETMVAGTAEGDAQLREAFTVLHRFFGTGQESSPRDRVPVEFGLRWAAARQGWVVLWAEYRAMRKHMTALRSEARGWRVHWEIEHKAWEQEYYARRYRCRRLLQPLVRTLLNEVRND